MNEGNREEAIQNPGGEASSSVPNGEGKEASDGEDKVDGEKEDKKIEEEKVAEEGLLAAGDKILKRVSTTLEDAEDAVEKLIKGKKSWLTQTKYFEKAINFSFDTIDVDKSGDVTLEELYAGLLLIHLQLAAYAGAPACQPASKEYVAEIFQLLDRNNSGTLRKKEFTTVMKILFSQVFTRIVIQWGLTLMIVPVISQYIVEYAILLYSMAHEFWKDADDGFDPMERLLWKIRAFALYLTPQWLDTKGEMVWTALGKSSKGFWKSMPLMVLTLALTSVALPYALKRVEDFFRRAAREDVRKHCLRACDR